MLETTLRLLSGILLIAANGFFVATEFALTRLRQFPQKDFEGHAGLRRAWKMTEELEIYLTGCQVGITFTSILLGIVVEPAMTRVMEPLLSVFGITGPAAHGFGLITGLVIINLAHTIWAEQTPTYLGIEKSKLVAKYCAIPHFWWTRAVYPLLFVGDAMAKWTLKLFGIEMSRSWTQGEPVDDATDSEKGEQTVATTRAELVERMGSLLKQGRLPPDRREEIIQAVRIGEIGVHQAMVAREDIVAFRDGEPFQETVKKIATAKHTRYPLVGEQLEDFQGIVYLPELFAQLDGLQDGSVTLAEIAVEPMKVECDLPVSELIDRFQDENQEMAFVYDHERVVGLVTLTDAVELIIGEAEDPLDMLVAETEDA